MSEETRAAFADWLRAVRRGDTQHLREQHQSRRIPVVGERVLLNTLLRAGDFPGTVVAVGPFGLELDTAARYDVCAVLLDCQDRPVQNVRFHGGPPEIVDSSHWQVCYPFVA